MYDFKPRTLDLLISKTSTSTGSNKHLILGTITKDISRNEAALELDNTFTFKETDDLQWGSLGYGSAIYNANDRMFKRLGKS